MITVRIAWNREAAEIMEMKGWAKLVREGKKKDNDLDFDTREFGTEAEARAYVQGIEDGNGWDSPSWQIVLDKSKNKIQ